jgi:hypothetical protein
MGNPPRAAFGYDQKMVPSGPDVLPVNAPRGGFPNGSSGVGQPIMGQRSVTNTCLNSEKHG